MTKNGRTIREKLLALLRMPDYRPSDRNEIARALRLQGRDRVEVRKTLRELEHAGEIVRIRKNRYVLPSEADLVTGKLSIHQAGYGFLVPEKPGEQDIFIAAENTGTAMNGDRVVARISRDVPPRRAKVRAGQAAQHRSEGRVIRILSRARDTIVGTLQQSRNFYYVVPDDPRLVHDVYVQVPPRAKLPKTPTRDDKVVVRLEAWESRHVNPEGEIIEVLGAATAPGIDMLSIIRKYDLPTAFPKRVLDEANRIPQSAEQKLIQGREDLRDQFIVTIDPDDARDFDDAINVEKIDNTGGWRLGVHIADVSAYVTPDSALDREARRRGNSVYLPDRVIPMLPERLSNGVCSLNPDVDRLTHSVFVEFDRNGRAKNAHFAKSVIRSAKRLTYKEAYAILQGKPNGELSRRLHTAWELASLLRRKRFEQGSLDLDFPEVKVHVDADGKPTRLERVENDQSHQLIEEFMLAANEAVARELRHRSIATIYRVHEDPDPEKLGEYREFILSFGYKVGDLSHRKEVQRFLASIKGKPGAGTQDRFAQEFEAGEIRGTTPRTLWFGQSQLPPFHQSNPTLRRFGGPSHAGRTQFAATIQNRHRPNRILGQPHFRYRTKRGRGRNRIGPPKEASVFRATAQGAQSGGLSRRDHGCSELWPGGRASGRSRDRRRACFHAERRFLSLRRSPTPAGWPPDKPPIFSRG